MKLSILNSDGTITKELEISDWVGKTKEIYNRNKQQIIILKETEKRKNPDGSTNYGAYRIKFVKGIQEECWIPKEECRIIERKEASLSSWG